jgi:undecaprenyl diphosphate synthase
MVIGERENVEPEMMALIDEACELTRENTRLTLVIAFNYGARGEITRAARRLAEEVAAGRLSPSEITPERLSLALDTCGIPDPDVLIRTSGECRLSNFLLWQCAYTEFVFLDAYWPDFGRELLVEAIAQYTARERRFGGLPYRSMA